MMYATEDEFVKDFVARTKANYELAKHGEYAVTQLINSCVGFLAIPKENIFLQITNDMVDKQLLSDLKKEISLNTYPNACSLYQIVRHMRNAVAHGRLEFEAEKQPINSKPLMIKYVIFKDRDEKNKYDFCMKLPVEQLEKFLLVFADAVVNSKLKKNNKL